MANSDVRRAGSPLALILLFLTMPLHPIAAENHNYPGEDDFVPVDRPPELTRHVPMAYPADADSAAVAPWVTVLVDDDGKVVVARIGKTSGNDRIDSSALAASLRCEFRPAIFRNRPVACWITYRARFCQDSTPFCPSGDTT
jgi:TonB family protein